MFTVRVVYSHIATLKPGTTRLVPIIIMRPLHVLLGVAQLALTAGDAGFTVVQTLEALADIEASDECHLVDFGRPRASYFPQAAKNFGDIKSSGCASALEVDTIATY